MTGPAVEVDVREADRLVGSGQVLLLDVREPDEWDTGHAPAARHLPLADAEPDAVPDDRPVLAICRSGNRPGEAASTLAAAGRDVRNVTGGMRAWAAAGLPVVDGAGRPGAVA